MQEQRRAYTNKVYYTNMIRQIIKTVQRSVNEPKNSRNWQQRVIIPRRFHTSVVDGKRRNDGELAEIVAETFEHRRIIAQFENEFQTLLVIRG